MINFDVIVVGAGHAGIEAALVSSKMKLSTLLITNNLNRIGYMSCNPSIGGLAKGHMVRELDILGGQMGQAADRSCIQFKRLNSSRGAAVRGSRSQNDKIVYSEIQSKTLNSSKNLKIVEGDVKSIILSNNICSGVVLSDCSSVFSKNVIITAGTFLNGTMHFGLNTIVGGRLGDKSSVGLSDQLKSFGFKVNRLKTGTPARLLRDSIDFSKTLPQYGDKEFFPFSFFSDRKLNLPQVTCYLSNTNELTHDIIRSNLDKSPMFCGVIEGVGPRYCPSIEDKVTRFYDKVSHQTFLEPESLQSDWIYLQGISTSLPIDIQDQFLKTIPGLENVKVAQYGYAVEYDFFEPTQIHSTLETKTISNLFLAGQINGTSGYEEAAVQGFVAGVNSALKILNKDPFNLSRSDAYIGVLIDDLITKGTQEPYRMFTSRAEHRLILREDNTINRLLNYSKQLGLRSSLEIDQMSTFIENQKSVFETLNTTTVYPSGDFNLKLNSLGLQKINKPLLLNDLLRRQEISFNSLCKLGFNFEFDTFLLDCVEIDVKYGGYISKQNELIETQKKLDSLKIPSNFNYSNLKGLSAEEKDKLSKFKPETLGQASRISGVNPSAVQSLMIYLKSNSI